VNHVEGESWRMHLLTLVRRFHVRLRRIGLTASRALFPTVTIKPPRDLDAATLQARLLQLGIRTVAIAGCRGLGARVALLVTVLHAPSDIDQAVEAIGRATSSDLVIDAAPARVS
jgi:hypothetical protein